MEESLKTNKNRLVMFSVVGKIHNPTDSGNTSSDDGISIVLPATGGITYNVKIGDSAFGWMGDRIEPGVSIKNINAEENIALMQFACIGNKAKLVMGDAKGSVGYVTGMHVQSGHVIIWFSSEVLEKLTIDDRIMIKAYGQGLELENYRDIRVMNIDPDLFEKLNISEDEGKIKLPVAAAIPASIIESLIDFSGDTPDYYLGEFDILTNNNDIVQSRGIKELKFGDLVLLEDCDGSFGRGYYKGAVTVGVVSYSDCLDSKHGPGITAIMASRSGRIEGVINSDANIGKYLNLY